VLANSLWFQVTGFFWNFLDDGFFSVEAFFFSGNLGGSSSTDFTGNLLTFGFWAVFLYIFLASRTLLYRPFGTFLFGGVTLGNIFTLFFLDGFTFYSVFINIVFFITGGTGRFVDGLTYFWTISFQEDWGVTEGNGFFGSDLLVFNETALDEVFFTVFFLLWFEISCVGGVTFFTVAVFASNNIVVFGFFNHDYFVDTSLTSSSNGANVKSDIIVASTASLTGITNIIYGVMSMMIVVISMVSSMVVAMMSSWLISGVKWESSTKVLTGTLAKSACSDKEKDQSLAETSHIYFKKF